MAFIDSIPFKNIDTNGYSKIQHHGAIFSNRTAALISMNGTIDWACLPNYNSAPIFSSILDKNRGGYFSVQPQNTEGVYVRQQYEDFTNILITEFFKHQVSILRITDFLPVSEYTTINFPEIHRYIETPSVDINVVLRFKPVFDYGKQHSRIIKKKNGYIFRTKKETVGIVSDFPLQTDGTLVYGNWALKKGNSGWVVALYGVSRLDRVRDYKSFKRLEETRGYWKSWSLQSNYHGLYHKYANRSALTLKGLFFDPTGLMVAAPTASLPEAIHGDRNWDYRFTWIRDTAYVIEALSMMGYKREATKFLYDIMDMIERHKKIRTIYPIDNKQKLDEIELDYEGYMQSKPVRVGNKAYSQLQIDQYGSIINAIYYFSKAGGLVNSYMWDFVIYILGELQKLWREPDSSLWEFRTERKHYVYSKLMAWTAYERAIEMQKYLDFSGPARIWKKEANIIKKDILEKGFNKKINAFSQYYGSDETDASLLRIPLLGFLPVKDARVLGTIKKIEKDLMVGKYLFKRYREDDGLKCEDNAFLLLSFWYIEDLIYMNQIDRAKEVFESVLDRTNHVGLLSEEVDIKTGDLLGNFPQAISHLGIIRVAVMLNEALKKRTIQRNRIIDIK